MSINEGLRKIKRYISELYEPDEIAVIYDGISELIRKYSRPSQSVSKKWDERDTFLITYGDTFLDGQRAPLEVLLEFLNTYVKDSISFLHILPFFPFSSDDGFSVVNFREVNPELGSWDNIEDLGKKYKLVFDAVINHVSASSEYMDQQCSGNRKFKDFLITVEPDEDISRVTRPRNLPLLSAFNTSEGRKWFWTTFSRDQIDLNYKNPNVVLEMLDILLFYADKGAKMIRLDAIPYLWKEPGTTCIHLPQTHLFVKLVREMYEAAYPELILLTETNVPHQENIAYFGGNGDEAQMIYNFSFPPLILFTLITGNAAKLSRWARTIEPVAPQTTYLNITATHDGIGLRPIEGILTDEERMILINTVIKHGGQISRKQNSDSSQSPYEMNITYFDAVNNPDIRTSQKEEIDRFILSQAIPLCFMGIPGIYIHSLLGTRNYYDGVKKTSMARSINRKKLNLKDLSRVLNDEGSLNSQILARYLNLLNLRKKQSAFDPDAAQEVMDLGDSLFVVKRHNKTTGQTIAAVHNITPHCLNLVLNIHGTQKAAIDLISLDKFKKGKIIILEPYQVRWLEMRQE